MPRRPPTPQDSRREYYEGLDRPEILGILFHPRPEWGKGSAKESWVELEIPVKGRAILGGRAYLADKSAPTILFFHGNGEIVADYHDMASAYLRMQITFIPVEYRGYGRSTGIPSVRAMMEDCHRVFDFVREWLEARRRHGPLIIMGRSLGSASALELASTYPNEIQGLILESAFARALPLLRRLGVSARVLESLEHEPISNLDKIRAFSHPTLIIHGRLDQIIPFEEAEALYVASPAKDKMLIPIDGADHNTLLMVGASRYMAAIRGLIQMLSRQ